MVYVCVHVYRLQFRDGPEWPSLSLLPPPQDLVPFPGILPAHLLSAGSKTDPFLFLVCSESSLTGPAGQALCVTGSRLPVSLGSSLLEC